MVEIVLEAPEPVMVTFDPAFSVSNLFARRVVSPVVSVYPASTLLIAVFIATVLL